MKSGLKTYAPRSTSVLLKFDYPEGSPGELIGTQILGLSTGDSDSVGLGRTQEIASLRSRCQYIFESHCSTLSHFWPLVFVPSQQVSSRPLIVPRVSSFAQSDPVTTSVCVALIDFRSSRCHTWSSWTRTVFKQNPEKGAKEASRPHSLCRPPAGPHLRVGGVSSLLARSEKETLPH